MYRQDFRNIARIELFLGIGVSSLLETRLPAPWDLLNQHWPLLN